MLDWSVNNILERKRSPSSLRYYVTFACSRVPQTFLPRRKAWSSFSYREEPVPVKTFTGQIQLTEGNAVQLLLLLSKIYLWRASTHMSAFTVRKKWSIFPVFRGIFGKLCSYSTTSRWTPNDVLLDTASEILASKDWGKLWVDESGSWSPGKDFNPSPPEYKAGIILAKTRHSVLEVNVLYKIRKSLMRWKDELKWWVGTIWEWLAVTYFKAFALDRNKKPRILFTLPGHRLASKCVPDEYQPSRLPLQELALSPRPTNTLRGFTY